MHSNLSTDDLRALDAAHHLHPFTDHGALGLAERRVIARADGVWLWDTEGNRMLDGMAGLWCVEVGHGRQEIVEAVRAQMSELSYYNTFFKTAHAPVIELSKVLTELTPPQFNMFFYGSSGSDSNDTIVRMVRTYWDLMGKPDKKTILSRVNAYHGSTVAAASLGGMAGQHGQSGLPVPGPGLGVVHIAQPYWFGEGMAMSPSMNEDDFGLWAARELERTIDEIGEDKVAAFIAEPIQGAGGVVIPPATYWPEVKRILDERDILFISDEVICGFGRTGQWFGCETYGTEPDFMAMAKGITSAYLPLGAVAVSDRVAQVFHASEAGEFYHGYTIPAIRPAARRHSPIWRSCGARSWSNTSTTTSALISPSAGWGSPTTNWSARRASRAFSARSNWCPTRRICRSASTRWAGSAHHARYFLRQRPRHARRARQPDHLAAADALPRGGRRTSRAGGKDAGRYLHGVEKGRSDRLK